MIQATKEFNNMSEKVYGCVLQEQPDTSFEAQNYTVPPPILQVSSSPGINISQQTGTSDILVTETVDTRGDEESVHD